jgi:signal peptidase II
MSEEKKQSEKVQVDTRKERYIPFVLSGVLVLLDQVSKAIIANTIPLDSIGVRLFNDFLWIVNTRNLGIAFSIGDALSNVLRVVLFIVLPLAFIVFAVVYCIRSKTLTGFQRWAIAAIVGGGLGNLVDRIFRPDGVVDFVSVAMYGFLGFERFPTFNVADASVTVGAILLILSGFFWNVEADKKRT